MPICLYQGLTTLSFRTKVSGYACFWPPGSLNLTTLGALGKAENDPLALRLREALMDNQMKVWQQQTDGEFV